MTIEPTVVVVWCAVALLAAVGCNAWLGQPQQSRMYGAFGLAHKLPGAADDALLEQIDALIERAESSPFNSWSDRNFGIDEIDNGQRFLDLQAFASPAIIAEVWRLTQLADAWGLADTGNTERLALRCLEALEYQGSSGHSLGYHHDGDTYMTVSIMLSDAGEFEGGGFEIRRKLGPGDGLSYEKHHAKRGDVLAWRGWDEHRGMPLVRGRRRVLVAEWRCCSAKDDTRPGEGRTHDSLAGLLSALRHDGSSAVLHMSLANYIFNYRLRSRYALAQQEFRAALELDETMCSCHEGLGYLADEEGREADVRQHVADRESCIAAVRRRYHGYPQLVTDYVHR